MGESPSLVQLKRPIEMPITVTGESTKAEAMSSGKVLLQGAKEKMTDVAKGKRHILYGEEALVGKNGSGVLDGSIAGDEEEEDGGGIHN